MAVPSPLEKFAIEAGAPMVAYGPPEDGQPQAALPAAFDAIELEYAAIRKHAALLDLPNRAVLEVTGVDRVEFLNRMVTQELKGIAPGDVRKSFWLNRKGRIDADLTIVHEHGATLLDVDVLALRRTLQGLGAFIITEDCALGDASQHTHRMRLLGPTAWPLLRSVAPEAPLSSPPDIPPAMRAVSLAIRCLDGTTRPLTAWRDDLAPSPSFELLTRAGDALAIAQALIAAGHDPHHHEAHARPQAPARGPAPAEAGLPLPQLGVPATSIRLRVIGWHAYNIARVESGQPLYNLDFGPNSLPAESGVLHDRVSFTKGCYLGQEVVARMHSRGQSKQTLIAVRFERPADDPSRQVQAMGDQADEARHASYPPIPPPGAALLADEATPIGVITSAAPSPLSGMAPIAFAQVKQPSPQAGAVVLTDAQGTGPELVRLRGVVLPGLGALAVNGGVAAKASPSASRPGVA